MGWPRAVTFLQEWDFARVTLRNLDEINGLRSEVRLRALNIAEWLNVLNGDVMRIV